MKRYFGRDDFPIALLLSIFRLADPRAPTLGRPPQRVSTGTGSYRALDPEPDEHD